jgi:Nuclease-related domain
MQITYCSPYRDAEGRPRTDARTKKEAPLALGPDWQEKFAAEDGIIDIFGDHLDDDYVLICNASLLEDGPDADLVLVGPNGVWAFEFVHEAGSFQAEDDKWLALSVATSEYMPVEPSPIATARDNASAVYDYLHTKDLPVPWVNPIILLTRPEVNFFSDGAVANIIKHDEITNFITTEVRDLEAVMDETDVAQIVTALKPFFTPSPSATTSDSSAPKTLMGMSTGQWIVIFVLALFNLLVLGGFAWLVFFYQ